MQSDHQLIALDAALGQMLSVVTPLSESSILPLAQSAGRVSAQAIISPVNVPAFDNSAMDGYAVRIADLNGTSLPVSGTALAGKAFSGDWPAASCIRIMTGAPLPAGCDAVIMQEEVHITAQKVRFLSQPQAGQNIRYRGEDIRTGDEVITAGQKLNIASLSLLAALGINEIEVIRKPRVALFSTGDELQTPGNPLSDGQIYETNRLTLSLLLEQAGCEVMDLGIIKDDPAALRTAFINADQNADVVISSAGISVGDMDYTKDILQQQGDIIFWRLAIKPGKPFAFGRLPHSWFCGLPGNPVSAIVTFYQLVLPLLAKLAGIQGSVTPQRLRIRVAENIKKIPGRLEFQRGILRCGADGQPEVITAGQQGSHILRSLSLANCFIVLERERGNVMAGEWVEVELFNHRSGH